MKSPNLVPLSCKAICQIQKCQIRKVSWKAWSFKMFSFVSFPKDPSRPLGIVDLHCKWKYTNVKEEEELFEFDDRKDILVRNNGFQCEKLLWPVWAIFKHGHIELRSIVCKKDFLSHSIWTQAWKKETATYLWTSVTRKNCQMSIKVVQKWYH